MENQKGRKPKEKRSNSAFAENLKKLLSKEDKKGNNLNRVAEDLLITRQSLAQYRDGKSIPDIVVLNRMANYFDVSTDYLLGRTGVKTIEKDLKSVCEYTGISEKAIMKIKELCRTRPIFSSELEEADLFIYLCESEAFYDLNRSILDYLGLYKLFLNVKSNNLKLKEKGKYCEDGNYLDVINEDALFSKWQVTEALNNLLDYIANNWEKMDLKKLKGDVDWTENQLKPFSKLKYYKGADDDGDNNTEEE